MRDESRARGAARNGYVWIGGRWDWRGGKWEWNAGRWERERAGKRWREPRWENRNGVYVLVDGDWIDGPMGPSSAPPALRNERMQFRRGFVFIRGHWDWNNGQWSWVPGRYESVRTGQRWRDDRWENRGGAWVKVDGGWEPQGGVGVNVNIGGGVRVSPYPTSAPPALQTENYGAPRSGYIWIRGRWDWQNGNWQWVAGHWERERANSRWNDGRWEQRNGQWTWVDGSWGAAPAPSPYPTSAPPALQTENYGAPRAGYLWIRGRWNWQNGNWQWTAGHWERERANSRWNDGRWEQRNGQWAWVEGGWVAAPPPAPAGPIVRDHR